MLACLFARNETRCPLIINAAAAATTRSGPMSTATKSFSGRRMSS